MTEPLREGQSYRCLRGKHAGKTFAFVSAEKVDGQGVVATLRDARGRALYVPTPQLLNPSCWRQVTEPAREVVALTGDTLNNVRSRLTELTRDGLAAVAGTRRYAYGPITVSFWVPVERRGA